MPTDYCVVAKRGVHAIDGACQGLVSNSPGLDSVKLLPFQGWSNNTIDYRCNVDPSKEHNTDS